MNAEVKPVRGITAEIARSLNVLLADEHVLYVKLRSAHWNVEGPDFLAIHRFFEEQYKQVEEIIDDLAERIRIIGHFAQATLCAMLHDTRLSHSINENNDSAGFITWLLQDQDTIIYHLKQNIEQLTNEWKDPGTCDFLTGILIMHEKMAWMLRAHLNCPV